MEQATCELELDGRLIVLAINPYHLAHREEGDLITAQIVAVSIAHDHAGDYSGQRPINESGKES